ncbi:MAG: hypothetical protein K6T78_12705 [Alicyclobacillus sp.]|nr:hypothetical protein [Alicyclobacillus sp.]
MSGPVQALPAVSARLRLRRGFTAVLDALYPQASPCILCHRPNRGGGWHSKPLVEGDFGPAAQQRVHLVETEAVLGRWVCPLCLEEAYSQPPGCYGRHLQVAGKQVPVYSAFRYGGFVQRLIRPWKYDGVLDATRWFAAHMAHLLAVVGPSPDGFQDTIIVPVPTSVERYRARGYHHTLLLASELGVRLGVPVVQVLSRRPDAGTQTAKSAVSREQSLRGAFDVACAPPRKVPLWLIDDVVTTGATLQACLTPLLAAGLDVAGCAVIAHVE